MNGKIIAYDRLLERWRDGDSAAAEILIAAAPRNLPPAIRRAERDRPIREQARRRS